MKTYNTQAIVLGVTDYKERDKIIALFSADQGRFDVVARGTKRITSKLNGHLEPGNICNLMVAKGRGFDVLANAFVINTHTPQFREHLHAYTAQKMIIQILQKLVLPHIPDDDAYNLLKDTLVHLWSISEKTDIDHEALVYVFTSKLLDLLGYRPELTRCTQCLKGIIAPHAVIDVRAGGLLCRECAPQVLPEYARTLSDGVIKLLLLALDEHYNTLQNYKFGAQEQNEFKDVVRKLLTYQLSAPLPALDAMSYII